MKYCLSCRQPASILKQAEEIKVQHRDYRIISDLLVDYPEARIIWELPRDFEEHKDLILQYNEIADSHRLVCCLNSLAEVNWFKEHKVPFYYGFPVSSYYDLKALDELGVEYVRIAPPLTHSMQFIGFFGCEIRAVPNVAFDAYIPRQDGVVGGWIRPEDIQYYEESIDVFEFEGNLNLNQEKTLWDIYKRGRWSDDLNILITNLKVSIPNDGLDKDFGSARAICQQRCMQSGNCHFCQAAINFAVTLKNQIHEELKRKGDKNNGVWR